MLADVIARLSDQVPDLRSVEGAAALEELRRQNRLPQVTPAAFVIPLGLAGRDVQYSSAGIFAQMVEEVVGVILIIRSDQPSGARVLDRLDTFVDATVAAIAGWAPTSTTDLFRLVRGNNVPAGPGTVVYQIDFALTDQLRIQS